IRNGMVRGFFRGVFLDATGPAGGHLYDNLRAENCTYLGLQMHGSNCIIRNCRVNETGGSTVNGGFRYGIYANGTNLRIVDNEVHKTGADDNTTAVTCGIALISSPDSTIEHNRLLGSPETYNSIYDIGILVDNSANVIVAANHVSNGGSGLRFKGSTVA